MLSNRELLQGPNSTPTQNYCTCLGRMINKISVEAETQRGVDGVNQRHRKTDKRDLCLNMAPMNNAGARNTASIAPSSLCHDPPINALVDKAKIVTPFSIVLGLCGQFVTLHTRPRCYVQVVTK